MKLTECLSKATRIAVLQAGLQNYKKAIQTDPQALTCPSCGSAGEYINREIDYDMSDERRIYYGCRCLQCYAEWFDQYSYHRTTDFVINGGTAHERAYVITADNRVTDEITRS